jgi:hypothetical protein
MGKISYFKKEDPHFACFQSLIDKLCHTVIEIVM